MELGLLQRDMRSRFKLEKETYANWEKDRCYPAMHHWPSIIEFLGSDPSPEPCTLGDRLLAHRRSRGLSRVAFAAMLGVDEATLWSWEHNIRIPARPKHVDTIRHLKLD